jgi:hypothetical protein
MKKTILAAAAFVFVAASAASMATPSFAQSYDY